MVDARLPAAQSKIDGRRPEFPESLRRAGETGPSLRAADDLKVDVDDLVQEGLRGANTIRWSAVMRERPIPR